MSAGDTLDLRTGGRSPRRALAYVAALAACAATAALASGLTRWFDPANIVMLFLLAVLLVAVALGRGPGMLAAFVSVALFDFFVVPPTFSFTVQDAQYLLTFAVMLVVALVTAGLTATLKQQAQDAYAREARTAALYDMARELSRVLTAAQAAETVTRFIRDAVGGCATMYVPDERESPHPVEGSAPGASSKFDAPIVELVMRNGEYAALDFQAYFPLRAATRSRGVLAVQFDAPHAMAIEEQHDLLAAVATLAAGVLERLHYVDVAQRSQLQVQSERLRSSILSALSHDIRTPLTALTGLADSLAMRRNGLSARDVETAGAIRDQARRLNGLVTNLLEMAKLNAGEVKLKREWQPLEEVVGASLALLAPHLAAHEVRVDLPADLPLLEFDAVLIERVLCNLVENAIKYAPAGPIEISARDAGDAVAVSVRDHGPGLEPCMRERIFGMFARGVKESSRPGVGLGLAIARAIVESHGGTIAADNAPQGGARFTFTLPKGEPPVLEDEPETAGIVK